MARTMRGHGQARGIVALMARGTTGVVEACNVGEIRGWVLGGTASAMEACIVGGGE